MSNNSMCKYPGICDFYNELNKIKDDKKKDEFIYKHNLHLCDLSVINEINKSGICIERYKNLMKAQRKDNESKIEHWQRSYKGGKHKRTKRKRSKCGGKKKSKHKKKKKSKRKSKKK